MSNHEKDVEAKKPITREQLKDYLEDIDNYGEYLTAIIEDDASWDSNDELSSNPVTPPPPPPGH